MSLSNLTSRTLGESVADDATPGMMNAPRTASEAQQARRKAGVTAVRILSTWPRSLPRAGTLAEGPDVRTLRVALLLFLAAPGAAWAADATIRSQDLPVGVVRMPAAAVAPAQFDLVAFHWQGPGHVLFKTRSQVGSWSGWRRADPEGEDLPDNGSAEGRGRPGWHLGNP